MEAGTARSLVRPIVTLALTGASIAAAFVFGNPEFLYGAAASAFGFWFADRAKESEAQRLAYGAAQNQSNIDANNANIKLLKAQSEFPPPATKSTTTDATRPPIGYRTIS